MITKQKYYEDSYLQTHEGKIVRAVAKGALYNVVLDKTIFYPEGGGQPSDVGTLESGDYSAKVEYVRIIDGEIIHQVKSIIEPRVGDVIKENIYWNWRYKYMRIHTAGHLLHDSLMTVYPDLKPLRGSHGKKAELEYEGQVQPEDLEKITRVTNDFLNKDLPVVTKEATSEELEKECKFIPSNLPRNKKLRWCSCKIYKRNWQNLDCEYIKHRRKDNYSLRGSKLIIRKSLSVRLFDEIRTFFERN